jgi:hypothetical protein
MRIIQTEIRDIWQYLNNQLRNRGNGGGQNWSGCLLAIGSCAVRTIGGVEVGEVTGDQLVFNWV